MLKVVKTFHKIIVKRVLRVCLTVILGSVFNLFKNHFLKLLPNAL